MSLEELKRKKMESIMMQQGHAPQQMQEQAKLEQQVEELEAAVRMTMTKEAVARYGNLKTAHPEKALQLLVVLGQALQHGQIKQVDDNILKQVLMKITPEKREMRIKKA